MEGNKLIEYLEIVKFAQVENELSKHFELRDSGQFAYFHDELNPRWRMVKRGFFFKYYYGIEECNPFNLSTCHLLSVRLQVGHV